MKKENRKEGTAPEGSFARGKNPTISLYMYISPFFPSFLLSGALKMQDKTFQDRTMTDKLAWPDFAGQDNDGQEKHHA